MIKKGIHINAIYQHYKGDHYRIHDVAFHHETAQAEVIYSKCDINGIHISIRNRWCSACMDNIDDEVDSECMACGGFKECGDKEVIVDQPFRRELEDFITEVRHSITQEFVKRFKFIKQL